MMYALIIAGENSFDGGIGGVVYLNPSVPDEDPFLATQATPSVAQASLISFPDTILDRRLYRVVARGTDEFERNDAQLNDRTNDPGDE